MELQKEIEQEPIYAIARNTVENIKQGEFYSIESIFRTETCGSGYGCAIELLSGRIMVYDISHFDIIVNK